MTLQEAVYGLPKRRRKEVELRLMFMREGFRRIVGMAEEMCVCDQHKVGTSQNKQWMGKLRKS